MRLTHVSTLALGLALAPAAVLAESHTSGTTEANASGQSAACENAFTIIDANEDGRITQDEAFSSATERFNAIDVNADGTLTREEYVACMGVESAEADSTFDPMDVTPADLAALDENGNGEVEYDEFINLDSGAYATIEGTGVTTDSSSGSSEAGESQQLTYSREDGEVSPRIGDPTDAQYWSRVAQIFDMFDADDSGGLSEDEWTAEAAAKTDLNDVYDTSFDTTDANSDGSVSEEEFTAGNMAKYEDAVNTMSDGETASAEDSQQGIPVIIYRYYVPM